MFLWSESSTDNVRAGTVKHTKQTRAVDRKLAYFRLFHAFLCSREATVDSPVITSEAFTVQLLQTHQGHVVRDQAWDAILGGWAEVDPVEAAAGDVRNIFVAVGFGIPCVAAVLLFSQSLPHVADTGWQTHLGDLRQSPGQ